MDNQELDAIKNKIEYYWGLLVNMKTGSEMNSCFGSYTLMI